MADWSERAFDLVTEITKQVLTLATGDVITRTLPCSPTSPVLTFIGVTSTVPFTSMSIKGVGVGNSGSASALEGVQEKQRGLVDL